MKPPTIEWDFKHIPSNRDEVQVLGTHSIDGHELMVAVNCTRGELFFVWDESYGKLISGGD